METFEIDDQGSDETSRASELSALAELVADDASEPWNPNAPETMALIRELEICRDHSSHPHAKRISAFLIDVARSDGVLPAWGDEVNRSNLAKRAGVGKPTLNPGGSARRVLDRFRDRFTLRYLGCSTLLDGSSASPHGCDGDAEGAGQVGGASKEQSARLGSDLTEWDVSSPHAVALLADLRAARAGISARYRLATIDYLISVAEGDGCLIGTNGKPNYLHIARMAKVTTNTLLPRGGARGIVDAFASRFMIRDARYDAFGVELPKTLIDRLRDWLATNPVVPARGINLISIRGVAEILDIPYADVADYAYFANVIRAAIASGQATLNPVPRRPGDELVEGLTRPEAAQRIDELKAIVLGLDKIPEHWRRKGCVDFEYIADLTGRREPTMASVPSYRRWVLAQARSKGTLMPGVLDFIDTVAAFRDWGLQKIEEDAKAGGKATWAQEVNNQKTNFSKLIDVARLQPEDEIGDLFGENFDDLVRKAQEGLKGESAANVRRGLRRWKDLRLRRLAASNLPDRLSDALRILMRSRGLNVRALADSVGASPGAVRLWASGTCSPSRASIPTITAIEKFFGLGAGTLTDRLGYVKVASYTKRDASQEYKALSYEVKQMLPAEAAGWEPQILLESVAKVKPLLTAGTQQGRIVRAAASDEHLLEPFDPSRLLIDQLGKFVEYKREPVPHPFLRSRKGRWRADASESINMGVVHGFYRFIAQPADGRLASGMSVDRDLATIAWMGCTTMILAAAGYRAHRFQDEDWGEGKRGIFYTAMEEKLLRNAVAMTHPVTGWLTQNPQLADTLVPLTQTIPHKFTDLLKFVSKGGDIPLLSEEDVAFARRDWRGFMEVNHNSLVLAKAHVEEVKQTSRDPLLPIAGLFNSTTPMADLLEAILKSEHCWADPRTALKTHVLDVRDSVMLRIESIVTFRPKNLAGLTFNGDKGQIRKRDGLWEIEVPYYQFKNWQNCRLFGPKTSRRNFHQVLNNEVGLYDLLDYYFFDVINEFPDNEGHPAFMTKSGAKTQPHDWGVIVGEFARHHLAWNPVKTTGIPGVASMNPYAFRHIKASDILQNSEAYNKIEEASFGLQTSETMIINHYGMLLPNLALESASQTLSKANQIALMRLKASGIGQPLFRNG